MTAKITDHHRQRPAYIYVRQSTLAQVRFHQESTERQYALREKALALGWGTAAIRTLDRDLGLSGAQMTGREDFKTLVVDVSMGQVGAVFAIEASRLARSSLDWHRLIELCAWTQTLVIDEDGCYDPADFNDGLLLGMKGTLAQAELHFLRARLLGGKLNKAKKGELRFPLPVGLCYDEEDRIILDPDEEVRGAVQTVFRLFRETGSAYGVMQGFAKLGLRFPKRAYGGVWAGQLVWGDLSHSRVLAILKNPSYAGVYVFGRFHSQRTLSAEGEVRHRIQKLSMDAWPVSLKNHHESYIPWDEFLGNQARLAKNQTNGEATLLSGPAREGLTLLQGLLLCGTCGRRLSVRYQGNGGIYPTYECNWLRREGRATKACMMIRADLLDGAVTEQALAVLQPAEIELALEALHHLEARDQSIMRQWQMRVERAAYEAQLAERRYQEVDPANRLVAATLERRWNERLQQLEAVQQQYAETERRETRVVTPEQKAQVLALVHDFPRLWHASTTQAKDRKRMLRLLIKDITVERPHGASEALLHIRWQGGACSDLHVTLPRPIAERLRYPESIVDQVRKLAQTLPDAQIAEHLEQDGHHSAKGRPFNVSMIKWIRYRYAIPRAQLKRPEELTVNDVARRFGVSGYVVYYWIEQGLLEARRLSQGTPYWITLNPTTEANLCDWINNSTRIQKWKHSEAQL